MINESVYKEYKEDGIEQIVMKTCKNLDDVKNTSESLIQKMLQGIKSNQKSNQQDFEDASKE